MRVFISYIHEEEKLAELLQRFIQESFRDVGEVFRSADPRSIAPGEEYLKRIKSALLNSDVLLVLCSPASVERPWINFEAGCVWIRPEQSRIVPICHSGWRKQDLRCPLDERQALQLDDEEFPAALQAAFSKGRKAPTAHRTGMSRQQHDELKRAAQRTGSREAPPRILRTVEDRTRAIINDLKTWKKKPAGWRGKEEPTVWTTAFLSAFAISPDEPAVDSVARLRKRLFLKEQEMLKNLARAQCCVGCIISPVNRNSLRPDGADFAIRRTKHLISFLQSNDDALHNIEWAVSEIPVRNMYVVGDISCFDGYEQAPNADYELTLRHTSPSIISANAGVCSRLARDLPLVAKFTGKKAEKKSPWRGSRDFLRMETLHYLQGSLRLLETHRRKHPPGPSPGTP
ncbi:MAG: toll/interleukin-1 receptor domain-containing protein [Planctomycetota bacterium]|nr:toll/interleukin-1 receptor domain-containing protein [Planctomycetota bacterium]